MNIERIKVCVVNPNYYRSSGVTVAIKRIYEGSKNLPIDWCFVDCKYGNGIEIEDPSWVSISSFFKFKLMTISPLKLIREIVLFKRFLKRENIQIVHVHHRRLASLLSLVIRSQGIKIVYTAQVTYQSNFLFKFVKVDRAVAISNSVKVNIQNTVKIDSNLIDLISNPAMFNSEATYDNSSKLTRVTCIARLDPVKNHSTLLKAWALVNPQGRNLSLQIVGEGVLREELVALTKDLNLTENVRFLGFSPEVNRIINESLFLILPSWVEGHPLSVIEAAGQKKATLVTDVDGSRDCVPDTSILPNKIDPNSFEDLSKAILFWLENPDKVINEGESFYNYWSSRASSEIVAKKYFEVFLDIMNHTRS